MLAYFTYPIDPNVSHVRMEYDHIYEYIAPLHRGSTNTGHAQIQAICSADASVDVTCSIMALTPWTTLESSQNGWPIFNSESVWMPCPDFPSFELTAGTVYNYTPADAIGTYRHLRFLITPKKPANPMSSYAAFRLDLSIR